MRKVLSISFRVLCPLLALVLLWRLASEDGGQLLRLARSCACSPWALTALGIYLLVQFLGAWRWKILLAPQNLSIPYLQCFRLTMAGGFFNLVIPGGVSGDIVKVGDATAAHPGKTTELALVDLMDRCIGLAGLFGAACLSILLLAPRLLDAQETHTVHLTLALLAAFLGLLTALLAWLFWRHWQSLSRLSPLRATVAFLKRISPAFLQRVAGRFGASLALYREAPAAMAKAFGLSLLIHLLLGTEFYLLGRALHETQMDLPAYLLVTQLANASAILPVTPGGLGVRDTVAQVLFQGFGATPASVSTAIPLLHTAILILWGIAGAALYLCTPAPKKVFSPIQQQGTNT